MHQQLSPSYNVILSFQLQVALSGQSGHLHGPKFNHIRLARIAKESKFLNCCVSSIYVVAFFFQRPEKEPDQGLKFGDKLQHEKVLLFIVISKDENSVKLHNNWSCKSC